MSTPISVIVPSFAPTRAHLEALHAALCAQSHAEFEVIVVDDASPGGGDYAALSDPRFRVIHRTQNQGPAVCRNAGAAAARHALLFFTDTDCAPHPECLAAVARGLARDPISVGDTITRAESVFGRAVALLGFPGGGLLGFDRVWRVDSAGRTRSFSSCNVGIRRETFETLGRFNEGFPVAGGEDTVLARRAADAGVVLRYAPDQIVYHVERRGLRSFLRWQLVRGRGNFYIKQHVPEVGGYLRLRLWTFANSFRAAGPRYAPLVLALLVLSVTFQVLGYQLEKRAARKSPPLAL